MNLGPPLTACLQAAQPFRSVLDLRARHGDALQRAHQVAPQGQLHAIEEDPSLQAGLRARQVPVHTVDLERDPLPFSDGGVDVVLAVDVLERVRALPHLLHEIARVLPVGGSLIASVSNLASAQNRALLLLGRQPRSLRGDSPRVRGFTLGELARALDATFPGGFQVAQVLGVGLGALPELLANRLTRAAPTLADVLVARLVKQRELRAQR